MPRWAMVIDLDKCTGCQSCTLACRMENNVPFAGQEQASKGRAIFWNEVFAYARASIRRQDDHHTRPCFHCENRPVSSVPVGATTRMRNKLVLQRYERCIGCRYCTVACPYGVRYFNCTAGVAHGTDRYQNQCAPAPQGVVEKCLYCVHRLPIPACVQACSSGGATSATWMIKQRGSAARPQPRAVRLLEDLGTEPSASISRRVYSMQMRDDEVLFRSVFQSGRRAYLLVGISWHHCLGCVCLCHR